MTTTDAAQSGATSVFVECRQRFQDVLAELRYDGWVNMRVDTLVHPLDEGQGRDRRTIRHHYTAGEWIFVLELDRVWHPVQPPSDRLVRIRTTRELPTVAEAISNLYGPHYRDYRV